MILQSSWRIETFASLLGCTVRISRAATGSRYLTLEHDLVDGEFVVRVADHGDAYGRADISVDPQDLTVSQAQAAIARYFGFPSPAKCRAAARQWREAEELSRCRAWIANLGPGYDRAEQATLNAQWAANAARRRAWKTIAQEFV